MSVLKEVMPPLNFKSNVLKKWGKEWLSKINSTTGKNKEIYAFDRQQSITFGAIFDEEVGKCLSKFLGDISIESPVGRSKEDVLLPTKSNCVEVGPTRVIGGIRPQNYDVAYRPDGPRFVFDSKTLNDKKSIAKNWQNMINDLGTESATIHTRFPYAIVAFIVVVPNLALQDKQRTDITRTLERLGTRKDVWDQAHLAESISLIIWDPNTGEIDKNFPKKETNLRIEDFSKKISDAYLKRYKGLPPHD